MVTYFILTTATIENGAPIFLLLLGLLVWLSFIPVPFTHRPPSVSTQQIGQTRIEEEEEKLTNTPLRVVVTIIAITQKTKRRRRTTVRGDDNGKSLPGGFLPSFILYSILECHGKRRGRRRRKTSWSALRFLLLLFFFFFFKKGKIKIRRLDWNWTKERRRRLILR